MRNDPVIEEIHKVRNKYAEQFGFDLDAMFADLKIKEKESGRYRVVRRPKVFQKTHGHPADGPKARSTDA